LVTLSVADLVIVVAPLEKVIVPVYDPAAKLFAAAFVDTVMAALPFGCRLPVAADTVSQGTSTLAANAMGYDPVSCSV
jgi:hypothetical protein